jgi:hypothetical protein
MPSLYGGSLELPSTAKSSLSPPPPPSSTVRQPPSHAVAVAAAAKLDPSPNELTRDELKAVASGALGYLQMRDPTTHYVYFLVVSLLAFGLAPRTQVLQKLRIGSTFVKEADGRWWVRMIGEAMKNGKPTVFALPKQLTEPFDFYFATIRPALLQAHGGHDACACLLWLSRGCCSSFPHAHTCSSAQDKSTRMGLTPSRQKGMLSACLVVLDVLPPSGTACALPPWCRARALPPMMYSACPAFMMYTARHELVLSRPHTVHTASTGLAAGPVLCDSPCPVVSVEYLYGMYVLIRLCGS